MDYAVFHAPYNKLVQKAFGRYLWNDFLQNPTAFPKADLLMKFTSLSPEESYTDRELANALRSISESAYAQLVAPSELITSTQNAHIAC
jgi:hydroxymethylglutaryl-CoA synthase